MRCENCCHGGFGGCKRCMHSDCDMYFKVGSKDIEHLLDIMKQKNINPKALGKFEAKFMK